jgi:hypothetical protein
MRNIFRAFTLLFALCLTACQLQKPHIPHIVDNVPDRAKVLAAQTQYLSPKVAALALYAYNNAQKAGYGERHILTIIDYSRPSDCNRFWVIDLDHNKVLFKELVAHGINSGDLYATNFSDSINSRASSVGMYMTAPQAYYGRHGYSLRLEGLEPGFNGNAWSRSIVIHPAPYVCKEFIAQHGIVGRSWGCPALNPKDVKKIISTIKGGTLIFAYANDPKWLQQSKFLH